MSVGHVQRIRPVRHHSVLLVLHRFAGHVFVVSLVYICLLFVLNYIEDCWYPTSMQKVDKLRTTVRLIKGQ